MRLWNCSEVKPLQTLVTLLLLSSAPLRAEPWPLDKVAALTDIAWRAGLHISPNGRWLAYTVTLPETVERIGEYTPSQLTLDGATKRHQARLTNLESGQTIVMGKETAYSWGTAFSPAGDQVAFFSDEDGTIELHLFDLKSRQTRAVAGLKPAMNFSFERPRWSPDGSSVVVPSLPEEPLSRPEPRAAGVEVLSTKSPPEETSVPHWMKSRLAIVRVEDGSFQLAGAEARYIRHYAVSPDGKSLAYAHYSHNLEGSQVQLFSIRCIDLRSLEDRLLADSLRLRYGTEWSWSPDSAKIAYLTGRQADGKVGVLDTGDGSSQTFEGAPNLDWSGGERAPVWSRDSNTIYACDGSKVYAFDLSKGDFRTVAQAEGWSFRGLFSPLEDATGWPSGERGHLLASGPDGQDGFWSLTPKTGQLELVKSHPASISSAPYRTIATPDGKQLIFLTSNVRDPGSVWTLNVTDKALKKVVEPNPFLQTGAFGERKVVSWQSSDGKTLSGVLLLPPGYKSGPLPTVFWVYGGQEGTYSKDRFGLAGYPVFNFEVLASRGYAVFQPEIPIRPGHPMEDINGSVLSAADELIRLGYTDPDRMALMGQSYGSYTVLCLLVQSPRFKAAVLTAAVVHPDLYADFLRSPTYYLDGQGNLGVTPWQNPQLYRDNSPFFAMDRITAPVLIGQGSDDSPEISKAIYTALKQLGKDAELRIYQNEEHVLSNPGNVEDFWKRRLEFLEKHL